MNTKFSIKIKENKSKDKPIHGDYSSNIAIELFNLLKKTETELGRGENDKRPTN